MLEVRNGESEGKASRRTLGLAGNCLGRGDMGWLTLRTNVRIWGEAKVEKVDPSIKLSTPDFKNNTLEVSSSRLMSPVGSLPSSRS